LLLNKCLFLLLSTQSGNFWIHPRTGHTNIHKVRYYTDTNNTNKPVKMAEIKLKHVE